MRDRVVSGVSGFGAAMAEARDGRRRRRRGDGRLRNFIVIYICRSMYYSVSGWRREGREVVEEGSDAM